MFVGGVVTLLYPVLAMSVGADDRYWYLTVPGHTGGSYLDAIAWTFGDVPSDAHSGRIATLAFLFRRFVAITVTGVAVATATPIVAVQAFMKLILLVVAVLTCVSFLRSLRRRAIDSPPVALSRKSILLVTLTTTALVAVGAQAHMPFRNGWTSYAPLTYTAVIVIVGSVSLTLWLARKVASGSRVWVVVAAAVAFILGIALNIGYELYYVAAPLVIVTLIQQPVHDDASPRAGRRAKLIVGGTFALTFVAVFAAIRVWLARLCSAGDCYQGAQLQPGFEIVVTFARNLLTAVPGGARTELRADLASLGWQDRMPGIVEPSTLLVAGGVAIALLLLWWRLEGSSLKGNSASAPLPESRDESRFLLVTAAVPFAAALGTAFIMALSGQAQELMTGVGIPYRNTMVTWVMLALTFAMLLRAATLRWSFRPTAALWVGVALVITILGGHTLAANLSALRANRALPSTEATDAIQWEVVLGDPSEEGDTRRCESLETLAQFASGATRSAIAKGAETSFILYHGTHYCSTGLPDLG